MSKQIFLPEALYEVDSNMTQEKLSVLFETTSSITGKVTRLYSKDKYLEVQLGGGFTGTMSFEDATIYPIYKENGDLSPNIYSLVGNIIQAKIISIEDGQVILSRKENMLEALESLKNESFINTALITGFSKYSAFFDIGAGITGKSCGKNYAAVKYKSTEDFNLRVGDLLSVKVTNFLEDTNHFELSRIATLPSIHNALEQSDVITCKVFDPIGDIAEVGYFVSIDDKYCGILDSPNTHLQYGDEVIAVVRKVLDKGAKLKLVKKVVI